MSADLKEANELMWAELLDKELRHFNKNQSDIDSDLKSVDWKTTIATMLKKQTSAPNKWISSQLNMGVPQSVSRHCSLLFQRPKKKKVLYDDLIIRITE